MMLLLALLADYQTPDWINEVQDFGVVVGVILGIIGVITVIVQVSRWFDKRRDTLRAKEIVEVVQPMLAEYTKSIQPEYRNGGESLADVAALARATAIDVQYLRESGQRRDETVGRIADTVTEVARRAKTFEERQREFEAREERMERASKKAADTIAQADAWSKAEHAQIWDALEGLGVDRPPTDEEDA